MIIITLVIITTAVISVAFASEPVRVTCIGDSITEGSNCAQATYSELLQLFLGDNYIITNAGRSGTTQLKQGLSNSLTPASYWDTTAWETALTSKPDIVTIMLGTNDAKTFNWEGIQQNTGDFYALDYVDMINIIRSLDPIPDIYLMVPPPLYDPYPFSMNKTIINEIYSTLVRDISKVTNTKLIDIYSAFRDAEMEDPDVLLTCDGCHPNDTGNMIIAKTIMSAIAAPSEYFSVRSPFKPMRRDQH